MLVNGRPVEGTSVLFGSALQAPSPTDTLPPTGRPPAPATDADTEAKLADAWDKLSAKNAQQGAAMGGIVGGGLGVLVSGSLLGWAIGTAAGAASGYFGTRYVLDASKTSTKENTSYEPPRSLPASV